MYEYSIQVLRDRMTEIMGHLSNRRGKESGGLIEAITLQQWYLDLSDTVSLLEGLSKELKDAGYSGDVEGNSELEKGMT